MQHSLKDIRHKLRQDIIAFLWDQWSAIGVAGQSSTHDHQVIDPEALLLVSSEFARYDARLFDEILDWLHSNGNLINLKRVFNIRKQYPLGNADILLAIAKKLQRNSRLIKWKIVNEKRLLNNLINRERTAHKTVSLFPKIPREKEALQTCDPDFKAQGLYRPPFTLRSMSQPPLPSHPANLIFKMRALFGCNSRAEILAWLLTHDSGHPAQIARDTHYFSKSVQSTLNEMASSGLVHITKSAREKHFRIQTEDWIPFYGGEHQAKNPPKWVNWTEKFSTIQLFLQALESDGIDDASEHLQASIIQQKLAEFSFTQSYLTAASAVGSDYLYTALGNIQNLINK